MKKIVSFSQLCEDIYVFNNFINKRVEDLTCVEIGAFDGKTYSNSLLFEQQLGARCVLVEPSPKNAEKARRNRPGAVLHQFAISEELGVSEFVGESAVSGLSDVLQPEYISRWSLADVERYKVITVPADLMLSISGVAHIDFLSIDVQGAELQVLSSLDWGVPIGVMCIELEDANPESEAACRQILKEKGFVFSGRLQISEIWHNPAYFRAEQVFDKTLVRPIEGFEIPSYAEKHLAGLRSTLQFPPSEDLVQQQIETALQVTTPQQADDAIQGCKTELVQLMHGMASQAFWALLMSLLEKYDTQGWRVAVSDLVKLIQPFVPQGSNLEAKINALGYADAVVEVAPTGQLEKNQLVHADPGLAIPTQDVDISVSEQVASGFEVPDFSSGGRAESVASIYSLGETRVFGKAFFLSTAKNGFVRPSKYLKKKQGLWDYGTEHLRQPVQVLPYSRTLIAGNGAVGNYFHWIMQSAQALFHYRELGLTDGATVLGPKLSGFSQASLDLLGIESYHSIEDEAAYAASDCFVSTILWHDNVYRPNSALLARFSDYMARQAGARLDYDATRKIYLTRRDAKRRVIVNEAEVCNYVETLGYEVVEGSQLTLQEQIKLFYEASHIVAPHGAGMSNIAFARPNARVHEIFQDTYINPCFFTLARARGMHYSSSIHGTIDPKQSRHQQNYEVDIDCLRETLKEF